MIAFSMKIQNVKAPPIFSNNIGVNCVMNITPIHSTSVQKDMAKPRVFVGYISEISTHGIGPKEDAKQAMYPKIKPKATGLA